MKLSWQGVIPAITTKFNPDLSLDYDFYSQHCRWLVDAGCTGLVPLGSLGEGATLTYDEKVELLTTAVKAVDNRVPIIAGIAALSTAEAVRLARAARDSGCQGLMVLPPYVYSSDWTEMKAHVSAVIRATDLPVILYNNPLAYRTDFLTEQVAELAREHPNLEAIKESSADVRRLTSLKMLLGDRLKLLVGVDDLLVEGVQAGATGWIAGLANAMPVESVTLFNLAMKTLNSPEQAERQQLEELYNWFLPLLRLDTGIKFVQLIKLVQEMTGTGSARVRPPRLELAGQELAAAQQIIQAALDKPVMAGKKLSLV